jgi:hypothetical protein
MKAFNAMLTTLAVLLAAATLTASGPAGIYAVVDRVVLEPNAQSPERIQIWGAFAIVDGGIQSGRQTTTPMRGYLYFTMPPSASEAQMKAIRAEWADFRAVAGTGQAVAFGEFGYPGVFQVDGRMQIFGSYRTSPTTSRGVEVRILPEGVKPAEPIPYPINAGIVKLPATGNHAAAVQQLKDALRK